MGIPILTFHEIRENNTEGHPYSITEGMFEKQLQYLESCRFRPVLIRDFFDAGDEEKKIEKKVILTFDDTHISNYKKAFPLLKKYGFFADFFITSQFIGMNDGFLTKEQLHEMSDSGMSIQSHTHSHAFLNDIPNEQIYWELKSSKIVLEDIVRKEVTLISCPGGRYSKEVTTAANEIGYKGLCISKPAVYKKAGDIRIIGRSIMQGNTNMDTFFRIVDMDWSYIFVKKLEYDIKSSIKYIIGNKLYHKLWNLRQTKNIV